MPQDEKKLTDDPSTAFPASAATPGQAQSRASHKNLEKLNDEVVYINQDGAKRSGYSWWEMYLDLRAKKWTWRKAAFIAWSCVPTYLRIPKTRKELATQVLGLNSDRTIRNWCAKNPNIEKEIERRQMSLQRDRVPDVMDAWATVASSADPRAHRDRITFLTHHKIYTPPRAGVELSGPDGGPIEVNLHDEYAKDMAEIMEALNPGTIDESEDEDELDGEEEEAGDE